MDEAGISNPAQEPYLVVAGVIVDADRKWKNLEAYYRDLAQELFPEERPERFVFHAKDIFHGTGAFDRKNWCRRERMRVLSRLMQVPRLFELPIAVAAIDRVEASKRLSTSEPKAPESTLRNVIHAQGFITAIQCVQFWMDKNAPDETAMLIAEDTPILKSALRNLHNNYSNRNGDTEYEGELILRAPSVIDALHFAAKTDALLLQIADHCAFVVKRQIMGRRDVEDLYSEIRDNLRFEHRPARYVQFTVRPGQFEIVPPGEVA